MSVVKEEADEERIWEDVKAVAEQALSKFVAMREAEGERMKADILSRLSTIEGWVGIVEERSPVIVEDYRKKLYDKREADAKRDAERKMDKAIKESRRK